MSTTQELTTIGTSVNVPGGSYMQVHDIDDMDDEKQQTIDLNAQTNDGNDNSNKKDRGCLCNSLIYYISPLTCSIGHSLCCIFYHVYNFFFATGIFIFDVTSISLSLGLCALFCIGLILLWLSFEGILILSRIDLGMSYFLVERNARKMGARREYLKLSVYTKNLPLCCCWNMSSDDCLTIMGQRAKHLFFSCNMFTILIYHILIRGLIVLCTCWTALISAYFVGLISIPIWYTIDNDVFNDHTICPFGGSCSDGPHKCHDGDCYLLSIDNLYTSIGLAVGALLLLPIALRVSNFTANINKCANYYFYTYYYSDADMMDQQALLDKDKGNHHTNIVEVDQDFVNL